MEPVGKRIRINSDALADFVSVLRDNGFNLGLDQYAQVQDIALALVARGELQEDPALLGRWLKPLLCTSKTEARSFDAFFQDWMPQDHFGGGGGRSRTLIRIREQ